MKLTNLIFGLSLICSGTAFADSEFVGGFNHIKNDAFRARFHLKGELYITDASGKKLLAPTSDIRDWRPGIKSKSIEGEWNTKGKGIRDIAVQFEMKIKDDNSITMNIKQYETYTPMSGEGKKNKSKLLREQTIEMENFAPISWVAEEGKDHRSVLRFTPELDTVRDGQGIDKLTIGGDRGSFTVTDNHGFLWGDKVRFGGVLNGIASHRGTFVMSLYPFKGGKEMGTAEGNQITLNLTDKLKVIIRNDQNLIPEQMRVPVYGFYNPKFKMDTPNSVWSFGQETVEQTPKEFGL